MQVAFDVLCSLREKTEPPLRQQPEIRRPDHHPPPHLREAPAKERGGEEGELIKAGRVGLDGWVEGVGERVNLIFLAGPSSGTDHGRCRSRRA